MATQQHIHVPFASQAFSSEEVLQRSQHFYNELALRRSVRYFSNKDVAPAVIDNIIRAAGTAPSGAHKQPWTFCVVRDKQLKKDIRVAAEAEEKESYEKRMNDEWLQDLAPIGTTWQKEFIETVPVLIAVFKHSYELGENNTQLQNYYVQESVGIACGMLIAAIHHAGLCTLTHTPSPMNFLGTLLKRPKNEKPFLLLPVGFASNDCTVPDLNRKTIDDIRINY